MKSVLFTTFVILFVVSFTVINSTTAYAQTYSSCIGCTPEEAKAMASKDLEDSITISVWTDKTDYGHNDMIVVTGQVTNVDSGFPVTITVISPLNSIVTIDSLTVDAGGSFETTLNTAGAMWKYDGTYTIEVDYGSAEKSNSAQVELTGGVAYTPNYNTPSPEVQEELDEIEKIPAWMKNIFLWYGQDQISEDELLDAIRYLINEGTLVVD